jgi:RNA polymerase sigma-70 factor, ECF subfamily
MIPSPPETRASLILRLPDAADVAAWDEVLSIYGPLVYRMGLRQGLQAADADDLVQEVFTAVARSVSQWLDRSDRGKFRAWLLRIARNTSVNFLTRRRHRPIGNGGDEASDWMVDIPAPDCELSGEFDLEYRREVFRWAADQIQEAVTDNTWQAFWLTHVDGRSIAEVAKHLGISTGNVYIGRSRVMSRFKELTKQFEEVE